MGSNDPSPPPVERSADVLLGPDTDEETVSAATETAMSVGIAPERFTVDDCIEHIGGFGRSQQQLFLILGFTFLVNGALNLQQVVVERAPTSVCSAMLSDMTENGQCKDCSGDSTLAGKFVGQFVDDSTVAATFELVCARAVLRGYLGSVFFLGFGVGSFCGGILSDKIGRRKSIFAVNAVMLIGSLSMLAWSYGVYVFLRFVSGIGCGAGIVINFVMMMECVGAKHRGWLGGLGMNGLWSVAGIVMGMYGAFIHRRYASGSSMLHEWQSVSMLPCILCVIQGFVTLLLPESPRWLAAQGDMQGATRVLERAADINGTSMPAGILHLQAPTPTFPRVPSEFRDNGAEVADESVRESMADPLCASSEGGGVQTLDSVVKARRYCARAGLCHIGTGTRDLFSWKRVLGVPMWQTTVITLLCWFTTSFTYYGLALNSGNLSGDFYANFCTNMAVDIPALVLSIPMFDRLGRARTLSVTLLCGGAACLAVTTLAVDAECAMQGMACRNIVARSGLAFLGKFMLCITFSGVFLYGSEIFPTSVRTQGMGISSTAARVGGILAPLVVVVLGARGGDAPMYVFGGVSLVAGAISLKLPETLHQNLADSV